MKNKPVLALALCLFVVALAAPAFGQPDPKKSAANQIDWLKKNITLTDDQLKKVTDLHNLYADKAGKMMEGAGFPPSSEFRTKMDNLHTEKEGELKKILTTEQWAVVEKNISKYKKAGRPR